MGDVIEIPWDTERELRIAARKVLRAFHHPEEDLESEVERLLSSPMDVEAFHEMVRQVDEISEE